MLFVAKSDIRIATGLVVVGGGGNVPDGVFIGQQQLCTFTHDSDACILSYLIKYKFLRSLSQRKITTPLLHLILIVECAIEPAIKSHREWGLENQTTEPPTYFLNGIKLPVALQSLKF